MSSTIDVGRSEYGEIFVAVPGCLYEEAVGALSGERKHIIRLNQSDAVWLIKALRREVASLAPPTGTRPSERHE